MTYCETVFPILMRLRALRLFSPVLLDNAEPPKDVLRGIKDGVEATKERSPSEDDGLPLIPRSRPAWRRFVCV